MGDTAGESWLNLIGISLDLGPPYDAARLGDAVEQMDPVDIRRHLLGGYAWSWCTLAGADTIDAAAAGDRTAGRKLLAHERYYAGRARDSLSVLLPLDPAETRDRLAHALVGRPASPHRAARRPRSGSRRRRRRRILGARRRHARRRDRARHPGLPLRPGAGGRARAAHPPRSARAVARAGPAPSDEAHRLPGPSGAAVLRSASRRSAARLPTRSASRSSRSWLGASIACPSSSLRPALHARPSITTSPSSAMHASSTSRATRVRTAICLGGRRSRKRTSCCRRCSREHETDPDRRSAPPAARLVRRAAPSRRPGRGSRRRPSLHVGSLLPAVRGA